jgi:hypothetical protein
MQQWQSNKTPSTAHHPKLSSLQLPNPQVKQLIMDWIIYPLGSPSTIKGYFLVWCGVQWMCNQRVNEKWWTQIILINYKSQIILTMYHIQCVLFWGKLLRLVEIFGQFCFSVWSRPNLLFTFTSFASFFNLTNFQKQKLLNSWLKILRNGFYGHDIYDGCHVPNFSNKYIYLYQENILKTCSWHLCNNSVSYPK